MLCVVVCGDDVYWCVLLAVLCVVCVVVQLFSGVVACMVVCVVVRLLCCWVMCVRVVFLRMFADFIEFVSVCVCLFV